jgi:hypothetical protein
VYIHNFEIQKYKFILNKNILKSLYGNLVINNKIGNNLKILNGCFLIFFRIFECKKVIKIMFLQILW